MKFIRACVAHLKLGVKFIPAIVGAWRFARTGNSGKMPMRASNGRR